MRRVRCWALAVFAASWLCACGRYEFAAKWNALRGDAYPLDGIERDLPDGAPAQCPPELHVVSYRGERVPFSSSVQVVEPFVAKLRALENIVAELGTMHFGRAPDRLLHYGARACRTVRGSSRRLSEHALGNALDLSGFEWKRTRATSTQPAQPAIRVLISRDWQIPTNPEDKDAERRHTFLKALVDRITREDIFRGVIGPGREGHADHLHLDQAPWSYTLF
jgi:hypothetical protein